MNKTLLTLLSTVIVALSLQGQSFTNLDFESARVIFTANPPDFIATSNAFPGWSVFGGTNQAFYVQYNVSAGVYLYGLVGPDAFGTNTRVLDGNFSASMGPNETMSQTGLVPNGAESLLFGATSSSFLVSLGSQNLSYVTISNALNSYGGSYTIYGADISGFAGQTETLTFSGSGLLDDIQFSTVAIPEPSAISLLCLGSGVLFYVRRRKTFRL